MKLEIHKSAERGSMIIDWLDSKHSFSFGDYYNPKRMNFGALRVLNEDIIAAGQGFAMHQHSDMEIVTIVLSGELTHEDSMGNKGTISANEVQRMSAGTGVMHSEVNDGKKPVHLLQIWVEPLKRGLTPSYEQKTYKTILNQFTLIASNTKDANAVTLHQNAKFHIGTFSKEKLTAFNLDTDKHAFVFLISGELSIEGKLLNTGDALAITDAKSVKLRALKESKMLVIQVPQ